MPIYEYKCKKCEAHTEAFQKITDKPLTRCRKCGGRLEKLLSAPAIQFKGSGWYVTDYAGHSKKAAEKLEKAESETSSPEKSGDKKPEKKAKDGSPAKKTSDKASSPKVSSGD